MHVMFVDDDPDVLEGLENRLRTHRSRWTMSFVQGADDAIARLQRDHIDVVVSESRMRAMSGVALLQRVRDMQPQAIRVMLSGKTDMRGVFGGQTLGVAHQVLSKPCEGRLLEAAIQRASSLRDLLTNEVLRSAITTIDNLPMVPAIYSKMSALLEDTRSSMDDIAHCVETDPIVTARLLQVVNSAFVGRGSSTTNVRDAIAYLGVESVRSLVLSSEMFSVFESSSTSRYFSHGLLFDHSLQVAALAQSLAMSSPATSPLAREAFSAGVLHNIGFLVTATKTPDKFEASWRLAIERSVAMHEAEQAVQGYTHAEVGACLLALWGLPQSLIDVVAFHHRPELASRDNFQLVALVHAADHLNAIAIGEQPGVAMPPISPAIADRIPADFERWRAIALDKKERKRQ